MPEDEIQPVDFERAFKKLDTIKDDLLFYDSYAQGQQFITQGSASMIATANSRAEQLKQQGDFDYTFRDAILYPWGAFPMPANAPARRRRQRADRLDVRAGDADRDRAPAPARAERVGGVRPAHDEELAKTPNSPQNRELSYTIETKQAAKQDADYAEAVRRLGRRVTTAAPQRTPGALGGHRRRARCCCRRRCCSRSRSWSRWWRSLVRAAGDLGLGGVVSEPLGDAAFRSGVVTTLVLAVADDRRRRSWWAASTRSRWPWRGPGSRGRCRPCCC